MGKGRGNPPSLDPPPREATADGELRRTGGYGGQGGYGGLGWGHKRRRRGSDRYRQTFPQRQAIIRPGPALCPRQILALKYHAV